MKLLPSAMPDVRSSAGGTVQTKNWTRRTWITSTAAHASVLAALAPWRRDIVLGNRGRGTIDAARKARAAAQQELLDAGPVEVLAQQAVEAARAAGAQYADARLTRVVQHHYYVGSANGSGGELNSDTEVIGLGVRALVQGYWGFAAFPLWGGTPDGVQAAGRLARDAVAQAKVNAHGPPRTVDFAPIPAVTGTWATPVRIDPFAVTIEEKLDAMAYWQYCAHEQGLSIRTLGSGMSFARQERIVATSDGSCFTQTCYESRGVLQIESSRGSLLKQQLLNIQGLDAAGKGWELFLDARIPEQLVALRAQFEALQRDKQLAPKPIHVGRYTLVCDGATMASLVAQTLGVATQLDRALGYEADADGTSFIDDPLAMVGHFSLAAPPVTVTANRSAPAQLATVRWDDEGVVPPDVTLVKDGVLVDFQTTREQAAWLAPYYQAHSHPQRSNGCAAAQDALRITMQMMPNLALAPNPAAVGLDDLVAGVADGILIERGGAADVDFQARNGLLVGEMREIKGGKIGRPLEGGAVQFNTLDLWRNVKAVGGASTAAVISDSQYGSWLEFEYGVGGGATKGQPRQGTGYSVSGVAATIANQPVIIPTRKI